MKGLLGLPAQEMRLAGADHGCLGSSPLPWFLPKQLTPQEDSGHRHCLAASFSATLVESNKNGEVGGAPNTDVKLRLRWVPPQSPATCSLVSSMLLTVYRANCRFRIETGTISGRGQRSQANKLSNSASCRLFQL